MSIQSPENETQGALLTSGALDSGQGASKGIFLPSLGDFQLPCLLAVLWTFAIMAQAPSNVGLGNLIIVAVYLALYGLFWAGCGFFLRVFTQLLFRGASSKGGGRRLSAGIPIAVLLGINLTLLVPAFVKGQKLAYGPGLALFAGVVLLSLIPPLHNRWVGRVIALSLPLGFGILAYPIIEGTFDKQELALQDISLGEPKHSIRLLGLDGTDLGLIESLLAEGVELPNFQRLIEEGSSGRLRTNSPHSPVVWTSIATGRVPDEHGVRTYSTAYFRGAGLSVPHLKIDFVGSLVESVFHYKDVGGVSSAERNVKALWEILTDFKQQSLMLNWWASFPAEPVHGTVISNHTVPWGTFEAEAIEQLSNIEHLVYPPEIQGAVIETVQGYVDEKSLGALRRDAFSAAGWAYFKARDDIMVSLYDQYWAPEQRLSTVYLQGIDTASHAYSTILFGENVNKKRPMKVSQEEADRWWQELVVESYKRMDALVGTYLQKMGESENLIVVSDHGWRYDGTSHWTRPPGVFLAYGPAFKRGYELKRASVYDVLPTLCAILGVPISAELEGTALGRTFAPEAAIDIPPSIPTYGQREQSLRMAQPESMDDGHIDRLKALGYVD